MLTAPFIMMRLLYTVKDGRRKLPGCCHVSDAYIDTDTGDGIALCFVKMDVDEMVVLEDISLNEAKNLIRKLYADGMLDISSYISSIVELESDSFVDQLADLAFLSSMMQEYDPELDDDFDMFMDAFDDDLDSDDHLSDPNDGFLPFPEQ